MGIFYIGIIGIIGIIFPYSLLTASQLSYCCNFAES